MSVTQVSAATTADQAVTYERHLGVRAAVALMVNDVSPRVDALRVVLRSVERQALLAGCGKVRLEVAR